MRIYQYRAEEEYKVQSGFIRADTESTASSILKELYPHSRKIELQSHRLRCRLVNALPFLQSMICPEPKTKSILYLLTELHGYLRTGFSILQSLVFIRHNVQDAAIIHLIHHCILQLKQGYSLSHAFKSYSYPLPQRLVSAIASAEHAGTLIETLKDHIDLLSWEQKSRKKVIAAFALPAVVFSFLILVIYLFLFVITPKIIPFLTRSGKPLPVFTQVLIIGRDWMADNFSLLILGIIIIIFSLIFMFRFSRIGIRMEAIGYKVPLLGPLALHYKLLSFSKTMILLLSNGVSIRDSLEQCGRLFKGRLYQAAIYKSVQSIRQGYSLSHAIATTQFFPSDMVAMIQSGELNSDLIQKLRYLSTGFSEYIERRAGQIVTSIQYFYMLILILYIFFLFFGFYLPMIAVSIPDGL